MKGFDIATKFIANLHSYKISKAFNSYGSFLCFEFNINHNEKNPSKWFFVIESGIWRITKKGVPLLGSADISINLDEFLKNFVGLKILNTRVKNSAFDLLIEIQNDYSIEVFASSAKKDESWTLISPDEKVFASGPGSNYTYE